MVKQVFRRKDFRVSQFSRRLDWILRLFPIKTYLSILDQLVMMNVIGLCYKDSFTTATNNNNKWKMKVTVVLIVVCALGTIPKCLEKSPETIEKGEMIKII